MIVLSSLTFDPLGFVEIDATSASDPGELRRRIARVATLDGGVALNNFGMTDADRTATVRFPRTPGSFDATNRLFRLYAFAIMSARDGVYRVALSSLSSNGDECIMVLLILEKLNAD